MKAIILFAIVVAAATACNNTSDQTQKAIGSDSTQKSVQSATVEVKPSSVNDVVSSYLQIKNALANDNSKEAATAGKAISAAIEKIDTVSLAANQKNVFTEVKDDIKEHGEHIGSNGDKIAHQREHFDILSKDMYDLVKAFKPSQTLYQDHCPMYNDNKGATWLSEVKEIKNPYLGKDMPTCGIVKEEIHK